MKFPSRCVLEKWFGTLHLNDMLLDLCLTGYLLSQPAVADLHSKILDAPLVPFGVGARPRLGNPGSAAAMSIHLIRISICNRRLNATAHLFVDGTSLGQ